MIEQMAVYVSECFSQGKGAELSLDLDGLPGVNQGVARVWLIPSFIYGQPKPEVLICCSVGGVIALQGLDNVTDMTFVANGFNLHVSKMLMIVVNTLRELAYRPKPSPSLTESNAT